jgi:cytoskeletal protein CcmA (bactofilin family)
MFRRKQAKTAVTYFSGKSELQGDLYAEGNVCVEGVIHGKVDVKGDLEVSKTGLIEGPEIRAHNLTVHGVVKSTILVEGRLTLTATARLEGDAKATALEIESGAHYVGYITTIENGAKALPASASQVPYQFVMENTQPASNGSLIIS